MLDRLVSQFFALILRIVLFAAGLVVVAAVLCAVGVFLALWLVRSAWSRLTGQPVTPWAVRFGPRTAWQSVHAFRGRPRAQQPIEERLNSRRGAADAVEAQVKERLE